VKSGTNAFKSEGNEKGNSKDARRHAKRSRIGPRDERRGNKVICPTKGARPVKTRALITQKKAQGASLVSSGQDSLVWSATAGEA